MMYESFYGLRKAPFSPLLEPDTQYIGEKQRNTLSKLIHDLLNQVGVTVVSGEVGCGKTTLVRYLNSQLENEVTLGVLCDTPCALSSFMQWILQAFEVNVDTANAVELHQAFLDFISEEFAKHRNVVLIVDEAQRLSARNLEELILLTYACRGEWMFQVVLVGQRKLRDMLRHRDMGYLTQRITVEYQLSPFNLDQTKEYILYRLKLAGGDPELFDARACELVYAYSKGIPRLINSICDTALSQGYEKKQRTIDGPLITEIVAEQTVAKPPGSSEFQSIALKNGIDNTKTDSWPPASSTQGQSEYSPSRKDEVLLGNDKPHGDQAPIGREQNDSQRLHPLVEARADSSAEATATIRSNNVVPIDSRCLHHLFEAQVDVRPQDLALICGSRRLSYEELEHRSNQLAHYLRSFGVGPGKLVSLYFERSEKPIVALLAVLKAGAGYVPIDPNFPMDRVRHILEDADVSLLLSENELSTQASSFFHGPTVLFDGHAEEITKQPIDRLLGDITRVSPNDLCYIIYTSGTTGRPKGIMTEHHNVVRFTTAFNEVCRLSNKDRVYQGFSLGFDGSVEEIWMAFSNGATLVVGTPEIVRFGNEVARLLTEQKVTFFSTVPTFLSLINEDLPTVRLVVVSGEQCPPELVEKWAKPGRRLLNVYGPTETTVNTTAAECVAGKPVTIGRALQGYQIYILDTQMKPVPAGEAGELYIGGVGLARGYLNQPELTRKHFVANHPLDAENGSSRLYRTGDLVSKDDEGQLRFLGRIDSQVKIRGFRIELSEIEAVLREHPLVYAAVVNVFEREGLRELAAYVVPRSTSGSFARDSVLELLRKRLPAYMVPGYLDLIEELPTLASGKINRKRLPEPSTPLVCTEREIVSPSSELERKIAGIWQTIFKVSPISIEDNFFLDLGGYSLLAAQVVTQLRSELKLDVSIRDIYRYTTIKQLAKYLASSVANDASGLAAEHTPPPRRTSREVLENLSRITRWCCIGLQAILMPLIYGLVFAPVLILVWTSIAVLRGDMAVEVASLIAAALLLGALPMLLAQSIALKWLVIGRYKPGKYPVWGVYYLRWWLVTRVQQLSGIELFSGTPVMSLYYRLMGARVGCNCIIDTAACAIYDLVTIGEDTCIGSETQILGYRIEDGMLIIGTIEIGRRCYIGIHSALGLNTRMDDDALLDDLSLLPDGETMAAGESRRGSPAQPAEILLPEVDNQAKPRHPFIFGLIHLVLAELMGVFIFITSIPFLVITTVSLLLGGIPVMIASLFVAVPLHVVWFCLAIAALKALILGRSKPGVYSVESWFFLRKWLIDALLSLSYGFLLPLYTTVYLPPWLRLLGAKIGARAEISVSQLSPDLVVIDAESFFADGSMIGSKRFFRGHVEFAVNRIGSRSFIGNNAIVPLHSSIGDNCLLGVLSAPPANLEQMPHGTEWLGSPAFQLPHRQKVDGFDISVTHQPTTKLYIQRYIIDALRILIPNFIAASGLIAFITVILFGYLYLPSWAIVVIAPPLVLAIAVGSASCVIVLKKLLMAPFKPVIKPLWSTYVWWNEVINGAYETIAAPALSPMRGTPFFNSYLRLLGCKIGRHVFLETDLFSEFDLVDIGDYVALNQDVVVQNHLFEDRIMKSSYIRIGDECSVGNMSVILYDTDMQKGAAIGPLSLLMKGETLPPLSRWLGIPTSEGASRATDGKRQIPNLDD